MHVRAAIFDLDGTLLDSAGDIADAANRALSSMRFPEHDRAAYTRFVGNGMELLMRRVAPEGCGEDAIRTLLERMLREYDSGWAVKTRPYAGIPELLHTLSTQDWKLAVLSNKPHGVVCEIVTHFFPDVPFGRVQGSLSPSLPAKPDPALALDIAASFGLSPAESVVVGDMRTDVNVAKNAGMPSVGVSWGFRSRAELESYGAWRVIDSPGEFLPLFG